MGAEIKPGLILDGYSQTNIRFIGHASANSPKALHT